MINSNHYTSPSRTIYSDRFIPSRSAWKFVVLDINTPTEGHDHRVTGFYGKDLVGWVTRAEKQEIHPCNKLQRPFMSINGEERMLWSYFLYEEDSIVG